MKAHKVSIGYLHIITKLLKIDLVYSPAQVTKHHRVELKDHDASEETKQWFEELKVKYPKVFSLNNEDIGQTQW